jgi:hypothetical protein
MAPAPITPTFDSSPVGLHTSHSTTAAASETSGPAAAIIASARARLSCDGS